MWIAIALAFLSAPADEGQPNPAPKRVLKIMTRGDGLSAATAYKVRKVADEYEVAAALGLRVKSQSLIMLKNRTYDVLKVTAEDGSARELWFDISSFYPLF